MKPEKHFGVDQLSVPEKKRARKILEMTMKTLMLSTALVAASTFGVMAQNSADIMSQPIDAHSAVPAFLSSDFTGMSLYTLDAENARALLDSGTAAGTDGMAFADRGRMRWSSSETFMADRDNWKDVGSINDIVMTQDGELRGVLIDVGGFLGIGARTVMVDFEDLYFVSNDGETREVADFSVVIAMSQDELENLPEWDELRLNEGFETRDYHMGGTASPEPQTGAPEVQATASGNVQAGGASSNGIAVFNGDYEMLGSEARTADRLIGADVYDANGENIGAVNDVVLDAENRISGILVDVGGFLGIGAHTVNLPIEAAQIGWNQTYDDVRVMVSVSGDALEMMPEHEG